MKIAFYKYKYGNWKDWLIAKLTKSEFSHCEIIFDDGVSFSSSPRDNGVRFKEIEYKAERWEIVKLDVKVHQYFTMLRKARRIEKHKYKYDWISIFFHWMHLRSYRKFICSDLCYYLLSDRLDFKTPQGLYEYVKKNY